MAQCLRPGCDNAAKNKYCSRECTFKRKIPKVSVQVVEGNKFEQIPREVRQYMFDRLGAAADVVLANMDALIFESKKDAVVLPSLTGGKAWGDWDIGIPYSGKDYRPLEALDYEKIRWIDQIGICSFIKYMKLAPTVAPFRDENGWSLFSPDKPLAEALTAQLVQTLPRFATDFANTSMAYGHAPFEQTWRRMNKYELGLSNSRAAGTEFIVPDLPRAINPEKLLYINRNKQDGSFEGFTIQQRPAVGPLRVTTLEGNLTLERREALILTYDERYRNLYGHSFYENLYPLAAWYEVAMRSMLRYIDRVAEPVVVGEGPFDLEVKIPVGGAMQSMTGLEAALLAAVQVSYSNAIVIPSNKDPETGERYFNIRYLEAQGNLGSFIDALEQLEQDMIRAGNAADRSLSQSSGGTGSYNIGEIHTGFTLSHSDMILTNWVWGMNTHWIPYASEYNRGVNGPPIVLMVQMLDPKRRQAFDKMISASTGMPAFKDATYGINWEAFLRTNNVPLLPPAVKQKVYEEIQKRATEAMKAETEASAPPVTEVDKVNGQVDKLKEKLANGHKMPIFLGDAEWADLQKRVIVKGA